MARSLFHDRRRAVAPKMFHRIFRECPSFFDDPLNRARSFIIGIEFGIEMYASGFFASMILQKDRSKSMLRLSLNHVAIHLNKTAVESKTNRLFPVFLISPRHFVVHAEIGIVSIIPGIRAGGTDGNKQRFWIAELGGHRGFNFLSALQLGGQRLGCPYWYSSGAYFRRDREACERGA
jgi:hypothetical protein